MRLREVEWLVRSHPAGRHSSHIQKPGSLTPSRLLCPAHRLYCLSARARSPWPSHMHSYWLDFCLSGCGSHCLQCQGPHVCTRCEGPFLLLEARCVQECGKGYFADHANRKCTGNLEAVLSSLEKWGQQVSQVRWFSGNQGESEFRAGWKSKAFGLSNWWLLVHICHWLAK